MDENIENNLEEQIGNLGGDNPTSFGKLSHLPGQQEKLSKEEEDYASDFLKRSNKRSAFSVNSDEEENTYDINDGWIPIDMNDLGIRRQFYPEDWQIRIKPATVEAIKNWSSINDDASLAVTNNVFNEIMKSCVSIKTPTGKVSWGKINSWDRFWLILRIREYTFIKGEAALNYEEECPECGSPIQYDLKSENLVYEFPDDDIVKKHWSQEDRAWIIDPKDYDVLDYPTIKLYVPTLEKDDAILQWAYAQSQAGKQLSEPFLRFLPWMLKKAPKDIQLLEREIKECKKEFNSWDTEMFSFMDEVLKNITINPSEKLKQVCPNCGEEAVASVRFPNGIKSIFAIQNKHRKFGSK